jgi:NADP-dependent aldehyde dehydrogenase
MIEIPNQNLIGFQYSAESAHSFQTFNPITQKATPWTFKCATVEEASLATRKAAYAFESFQALTLKERAAFLRAIAIEILALGDFLIDTYCTETGLPAARAMGERGRTIGQLEGFATALENGQFLDPVIDREDLERSPIPKVDIRKINYPLGPIVVFGASNFPLAYSTAGGDTASALATGCPVIVKGHPMHAATGALVASAILKAAKDTGMPEGVFSNLNSNSYELGQQLVKDPLIKGVGFTGSVAGGTALYQLAQSRSEPIPVFAEMGSVNPIIVLPEALDLGATDWAEAYAASIALGSGQFCTNPGLIFCVEGPKTALFISHLKAAFSKISPTVMLHPNIHAAYNKGRGEVAEKAQLLATTQPQELKSENGFGEGAIYEVNATTFAANPSLHLEVFGPMSLVVRCKNIAELIPLIANLEGQLTGTILGTEKAIAAQPVLVNTLKDRVGRIIFNGVPTGVEVCAAMQHGGPFPASSDARFTAVGVHAMKRWLRPISFQNWPQLQLPLALQEGNPLKIWRLVDGSLSLD